MQLSVMLQLIILLKKVHNEEKQIFFYLVVEQTPIQLEYSERFFVPFDPSC